MPWTRSHHSKVPSTGIFQLSYLSMSRRSVWPRRFRPRNWFHSLNSGPTACRWCNDHNYAVINIHEDLIMSHRVSPFQRGFSWKAHGLLFILLDWVKIGNIYNHGREKSILRLFWFHGPFWPQDFMDTAGPIKLDRRITIAIRNSGIQVWACEYGSFQSCGGLL